VGAEADTEEIAELPIEVADTALGMFDIADDHVGQSPQSIGEQAQGDGLAGPWVSGEQRESAVRDAELDAAKEGVDHGRGVEGLGGDIRTEGGKLEPIEGEKLGGHCEISFSGRSIGVLF